MRSISPTLELATWISSILLRISKRTFWNISYSRVARSDSAERSFFSKSLSSCVTYLSPVTSVCLRINSAGIWSHFDFETSIKYPLTAVYLILRVEIPLCSISFFWYSASQEREFFCRDRSSSISLSYPSLMIFPLVRSRLASSLIADSISSMRLWSWSIFRFLVEKLG